MPETGALPEEPLSQEGASPEEQHISEVLESSGFDEVVSKSITDSVEAGHLDKADLSSLIEKLKAGVQETLFEKWDELSSSREKMTEEEWNQFLIAEAQKILESRLQAAIEERRKEAMGWADKSGAVKDEVRSIREDLERLGMTLKEEKDQLVEELAALRAENAELKEKLAKSENENAELEKLARIDVLCEIPNRRAIFEEIDNEIARARREKHGENGKPSPLTLLFIDLDYFKKINDTHGHSVGDLALKEVAARLKKAIRETDFVARAGGEEFVVLLPDTSGTAARKTIASKILGTISEEPLIVPMKDGPNIEISLTASIGVAELKNGEDTAETLIRRADDCMYIAKDSGRNRVVFIKDTEELKKEVAKRQAAEAAKKEEAA